MTMRHTRAAAVLTTLLLPASCLAQDLTELLSGRTYPLATMLKDFTGEWRRVTVHTATSASGNLSLNVTGGGDVSSNQNNLTLGETSNYLTRGQTGSAGGQVYVVAYHLPNTGLDLGRLLQAVAAGKPPEAATLMPETALPLALLDLRTAGSLDDVRAFDMKAEIAESETAAKMIALLFKALTPPPQPKAQPKK
jgi:hypothetical protein